MKRDFLFLLFIILGLSLESCGGCSHDEKKETSAVKAKTDIPVDTALRSRLKEFVAKPRVQGRFGLYVYDLTADKPVFAEDADHAQPVASNMKLLSGVAALQRLGADYKYRTSLYTRGAVVGDTLRGDIAIMAGLDPLLKAEDMRMFSRELRRIGIRHIQGNCYLDLTLGEKVKAEEHWYPWDLSFSHYGILFKGPEAITKAVRNALTNSGVSFVRNTGESSASFRNGNNRIVIASSSSLSSGNLPIAKKNGWRCRFRFYRSVDRVTKLMWKNSSNTQATSLLYTLGSVVNPNTDGSADSLASAGVAYLRAFLRDSLNQGDSALVVHDGCGLCTYNHLSPRALVAILAYGYQHKPIYRQLMQNLSISGVDGTLRRLLSDYRLRGRIHAKTGTLSHPFGISSLAGYCKGKDGHDLCFALLCSEMSVLDAHVLQRKLCLELVE